MSQNRRRIKRRTDAEPMKSKTYYITTAIPYVNAAPHIGFALELVFTDIIARYHRLRDEDVFFLTGTDENALKNVVAAREAGKNVKEFVDQNALEVKKLKDVLNLSWDDFIRTSEPRHKKVVQELLQKVYDKGDIYQDDYSGDYCYDCERYLAKDDLNEQGQCSVHLIKPEFISFISYPYF